ncbi:MAG: hypothetical protein B6D36_07060 [Planctomycetes bacterium UTPLA1]|nr:MAG: hypothetical protein B6D36_07060 [Planctomycetes bacterium UTPLA1]
MIECVREQLYHHLLKLVAIAHYHDLGWVDVLLDRQTSLGKRGAQLAHRTSDNLQEIDRTESTTGCPRH